MGGCLTERMFDEQVFGEQVFGVQVFDEQVFDQPGVCRGARAGGILIRRCGCVWFCLVGGVWLVWVGCVVGGVLRWVGL